MEIDLKRTNAKTVKIEGDSVIPLNGVSDRIPDGRPGGWVGREIKIEWGGGRIRKEELIIRLK